MALLSPIVLGVNAKRNLCGMTFGSFNNPGKLSESSLAASAQILRSVPRSRLVLKYGSKLAGRALAERLNDRFGAAGIDPDRISFLPSVQSDIGHLKAIQSVDLALAPFPYQGTMTTLETLSAGVPVMTLMRRTYRTGTNRRTSGNRRHRHRWCSAQGCPVVPRPGPVSSCG